MKDGGGGGWKMEDWGRKIKDGNGNEWNQFKKKTKGFRLIKCLMFNK